MPTTMVSGNLPQSDGPRVPCVIYPNAQGCASALSGNLPQSDGRRVPCVIYPNAQGCASAPSTQSREPNAAGQKVQLNLTWAAADWEGAAGQAVVR